MKTLGVFAMIFNEEDRILCVKMNYGNKNWTTPGGRVDSCESPVDALRREVLEESGFIINHPKLIGVYAKPFEDDLVLSFRANVVSRQAWRPDAEISEIGWFGVTELPVEMTFVVRTRIEDAFAANEICYREFSNKDCLSV